MHNFKTGDLVLFGRPNGEKTPGIIVRCNPKKAKIQITEDRGSRSKAGQVWNVPYSMIYLVDAPVKKYPAATLFELFVKENAVTVPILRYMNTSLGWPIEIGNAPDITHALADLVAKCEDEARVMRLYRAAYDHTHTDN